MALADVQEAILKKAREEAEALLQEARRMAEARWERESARLREAQAHRIAAMKAELEGALEREVARRESEGRQKLLRVKNEIIDDVFREAVGGVLALPDEGYRRWLKAQLGRAAESGGRVAANERDRPILAQLLQEMQNANRLTLSDSPVRIQGGFLVHGEKADLDFSLEALLGSLRDCLAEMIGAALFGEETT